MELIDTCWDVNRLTQEHGNARHTELIDTCWDVNTCNSSVSYPCRFPELIDTCWDVNHIIRKGVDLTN